MRRRHRGGDCVTRRCLVLMSVVCGEAEGAEAEGGEETVTGAAGDWAVFLLRALRGFTVFVLIALAGLLLLHARLTNGLKEDLIDGVPILAALLVLVIHLTRALRRRQQRGL